MLLYQNIVMIEAGMPQEAMEHLNVCGKQILDRLAGQEKRGIFTGKMWLPVSIKDVRLKGFIYGF